MILECASCAKMYRIRDDASPQPTKCPTCNGNLRATGGVAPGGATSRVKELETKVLSLELLSLRSDVERKLKDKHREIAQARDAADRDGAERRKLEARSSGTEETHARALEGKEKTIQALVASIAS